MNKSRRDMLSRSIDRINEAKNLIDDVSIEEEMAMENMPENLQETERYTSMEENVENLQASSDLLDEVLEYIEEIINK